MMTGEIFADNVIQGLATSICLAAMVLLIATHNIYLTFFSILSIACIISSVIGIIQMMGWKIGISESLAADFFVGFSVDYIVHVAHQYESSPYTTRHMRVKTVYQNIGLAVFSGAATTFMAVTFLYFTQVYVLYKFAIMMQLTLGFSILYALVILPSILSAFGPEGF